MHHRVVGHEGEAVEQHVAEPGVTGGMAAVVMPRSTPPVLGVAAPAAAPKPVANAPAPAAAPRPAKIDRRLTSCAMIAPFGGGRA